MSASANILKIRRVGVAPYSFESQKITVKSLQSDVSLSTISGLIVYRAFALTVKLTTEVFFYKFAY